MRPSRITLKISTPRTISEAKQPSATPAMLAAARYLLFIMSTEPSKDDVHYMFKEHEDAPAINLCAADELQLGREESIVLKPTTGGAAADTCEHCRMVARDQGMP